MAEFPSDNRWPKTPGIERTIKRLNAAYDAPARRDERRDRAAAATARKIFGPKPSAKDVLTAWLNTQPGPHYIEYISDRVLYFAALLALGDDTE